VPAIFYSIYPAQQPGALAFQYRPGNWYVTSTGSQFRCAAGTGIQAGKLSWSKPASGPYPRNVNTAIAPGIPEIISIALAPSVSLVVNNVTSQGIVEFYGGTAIYPTGGTSATNGGTTPIYNMNVVPPLPTGLTLVGTPAIKSANATDGTGPWLHNSVTYGLSGTPTTASPLTPYTVTVTDQAGTSKTSTFNLEVTATGTPVVVATPPVLTSAARPGGTVGVAYTTTISVNAGTGTAPFTFSLQTGTLPNGLTLNSTTGVISGTPSGPQGTASFTIAVADSFPPPKTGAQSYSIAIAPGTVVAPLGTVVGTIPTLFVGQPFTAFRPVTPSGGVTPYVYSQTGLPAGLVFNVATGFISGSASVAATAVPVTVTVTDNATPTPGTSSKTFNLTVNPIPALLLQQTTTTFLLSVNSAITAFNPVTIISTATGFGSVTWAVTPNIQTATGLVFNTTNGQISGTPTIQGSQQYTVSVTDSLLQTDSKNFALTINAGPVVAVAVLPSTYTFTKGVAVSTFRPVNGSGGFGSLVYTITPDISTTGLSFSTTGTISGTPTSNISKTFYTVTAFDQIGASSSTQFDLTINLPPALSVSTVVAPQILTYNIPVTTAIQPVKTTGGFGSVSYSVSPTLPNALTFSTSTGAFSGVPLTLTSPTSFTVTASDTLGQTTASSFLLSIVYPPIVTAQSIPSVVLIKDTTFANYLRPVTVSSGVLGLLHILLRLVFLRQQD
jgi:hypothetical protein